jgi:hypothetical protein
MRGPLSSSALGQGLFQATRAAGGGSGAAAGGSVSGSWAANTNSNGHGHGLSKPSSSSRSSSRGQPISLLAEVALLLETSNLTAKTVLKTTTTTTTTTTTEVASHAAADPEHGADGAAAAADSVATADGADKKGVALTAASLATGVNLAAHAEAMARPAAADTSISKGLSLGSTPKKPESLPENGVTATAVAAAMQSPSTRKALSMGAAAAVPLRSLDMKASAVGAAAGGGASSAQTLQRVVSFDLLQGGAAVGVSGGD